MNADEKGILINLMILDGYCIKLVLIIDMIDDASKGKARASLVST